MDFKYRIVFRNRENLSCRQLTLDGSWEDFYPTDLKKCSEEKADISHDPASDSPISSHVNIENENKFHGACGQATSIEIQIGSTICKHLQKSSKFPMSSKTESSVTSKDKLGMHPLPTAAKETSSCWIPCLSATRMGVACVGTSINPWSHAQWKAEAFSLHRLWSRYHLAPFQRCKTVVAAEAHALHSMVAQSSFGWHEDGLPPARSHDRF